MRDDAVFILFTLLICITIYSCMVVLKDCAIATERILIEKEQSE